MQVQILTFIATYGTLATEANIAKYLFNGRVRPARAALQSLLWAGILVPMHGAYVLSDNAKACLGLCYDKISSDQTMSQIASAQ